MKNKVFLVLISLCIFLFAFAVTVNAEENVPEVTHTYYLVQSLDSEAAQGKENAIAIDSLIGSTGSDKDESPFFKQFEAGSHVEIIFAENILTAPADGTGILINTPITVTFRYNGFIHVIDNGNARTGICVRNGNAHVRFIGSKAYDLNDGKDYSLNFITPKGDIGKGTFDLNGCNADVYHYGKVYCWVYAGTTYAENIRSITGQEFIYTEASASGTYEFKNCVASSNSTSVGLQGQSAKTVKIDGGYYEGLTAFSVLTGSYVKNAVITDTIFMDCWGISGQVWEFTNCTVSKFSTASGRTHFKLVDCKISLGKDVGMETVFNGLGSDGGGSCYAVLYTSATCDKAGSVTIYKQGSAGLPVTNDSKYTDAMVAEYVAANPAKGHTYVQGEVDNSYCPMGACFNTTCAECDFEAVLNWENKDAEIKAHVHTKLTGIKFENGYLELGVKTYNCEADGCTSKVFESTDAPLVGFLGYSSNYTGDKVCVSYELNKEMISAINGVNDSFQIGVVAAVESVINTNAPIVNNGDGTISRVSNNVIAVDCADLDINRVDLMIMGDFKASYSTLPLLMSLYVFDGDNVAYVYDSEGKANNISSKVYGDFAIA